jgi:predicted RNA-binding protein associated with RNAse of E/G family
LPTASPERVRRFAPGESVALREIWRDRIWAARAATVVEDREDQTTLFIPVGTTWMGAVRDDGTPLRIPEDGFELAPRIYDEAHVLSFAWPDVAHATLAFFRADWAPWSWYVNLQEPLRRTGVGFDTLDHELDVIVEFDGAWRWKDEDELAEAITRGLIPVEDESRLRAEGERAVRHILEREPPFDRDWTTWRPDPAWPPPALPDGWDEPEP